MSEPPGQTLPSPPQGASVLAPLLLLLLVLVAVSACNWSRLRSTPYSSDQIGIATLALKYRHPNLYPTETGLRPFDIYPRTYLGVLNLLVSLTGGIKPALFALGTLLLFVFAVGMFLLLRETIGNPWVAAFVAIAALWFRASFAGQQWQVADPEAFLPRTIAFALVPWLLMACGRWLGRAELVVVFGALGIVANYHPLSGIFLAPILGITLLLMPKHRLRHVAILAVSVAVFSAAAAPYFLEVNRLIRTAVAAQANEPPPTPEQIREAREATPYAVFPPPAATMRWVGFHLLLPAAAGAAGWWFRRRKAGDRERLVAAFLWAVLICSVGAAATEALLRKLLGVEKSFTFLRAFHLVYLPLWVFCGWLIEDLWKRPAALAKAGAAVLVAALLVPASAPEWAIRWVKYEGKIPRRPTLELDGDFMALCQWVRAHTDVADTFVVPTNWHLFPMLAERSMVASVKESSFIIYEPATGVKTYERYRSVQAAYENPSPAALLEAARRYGARYVVTQDRALEGTPVFQSGPYRVYAVRP